MLGANEPHTDADTAVFEQVSPMAALFQLLSRTSSTEGPRTAVVGIERRQRLEDLDREEANRRMGEALWNRSSRVRRER